MDKICNNCQYFDRCASNPKVGDCRCTASKYYRDAMSLNETCQYCTVKGLKDEKS